MRSLLDVNVLVALLDVDHGHHDRARAWLREHGAPGWAPGWATCSVTQLGVVRVLSQAAYPGAPTVAVAAAALARATGARAHEFWADDVSFADPARVDVARLHGPGQLTDAHLLALAVRRGGRLVSFDRRITVAAVAGAGPEHLVTL